MTYSALFDYEKAATYYKKAIAIDPDYLEAHANYAGMLLDIGDVDEAIRQVNAVLQRQPDHATALTMLAEAYRLKELYAQAIDAAHKSHQAGPRNRRSAPVAGRQSAPERPVQRGPAGIRPVSGAEQFR